MNHIAERRGFVPPIAIIVREREVILNRSSAGFDQKLYLSRVAGRQERYDDLGFAVHLVSGLSLRAAMMFSAAPGRCCGFPSPRGSGGRWEPAAWFSRRHQLGTTPCSSISAVSKPDQRRPMAHQRPLDAGRKFKQLILNLPGDGRPPDSDRQTCHQPLPPDRYRAYWSHRQ